MKLFIAFILLQFADLGTTLGAISLGGVEQNPIVGHLMGLGTVAGLALAKLLAVILGGIAAFSGKQKILRSMNLFFIVVVAWNLSIIGRLI